MLGAAPAARRLWLCAALLGCLAAARPRRRGKLAPSSSPSVPPPLPAIPEVAAELIKGSIYLRCTFGVPFANSSVGFIVTWSRLSPEGLKEELKHETAVHMFSLLELDGINVRLGDKVYCSSSAFFMEEPDIQSSSVESKEFFAGIKIHPETHDISEDGKEYRLAIESSIPIPCPEFRQLGSDCKISLTLNTVDTGTFVLYKSTSRDFEVHVRQWDCGSLHYPASCNCGFVAKEGSDIIAFDMCSGQLRLDVTAEYLGPVDLVRGLKKRSSAREMDSSTLLQREDNQTKLHKTSLVNTHVSATSVGNTGVEREGTSSSGNRRNSYSYSSHLHKSQSVTSREKRQNYYEYHPVFLFQSLSQTDLEGYSYFFPEDHATDTDQKFLPSWPTPSGLTESSALLLCQQTITNSSIGRSCGGLLGRRIEDAINMCVKDLLLKDDLSWAEASLALLENECEKRVLEEINYNQQELEESVESLLIALKCPGLCNGNGECTEWGCACFQGYSSYDCSIMPDQAPEITELENAGLCDIRQYDCTSVRAFGHGFRESLNLKCEIIKLQYSDSQWIPGEHVTMPAAFQNARTVDCQLPNDGQQSDVMDLVDDKPIARWQIKKALKTLMLKEGIP
ncbi:von Willebrand factor D and EGF domain-containing protein [Grus japonensis]|uniref:von Willebrand factor D and EGF domain-containing protein n=1 Tax=Grus japonensis TaxID=30415 RepID=A0ABC9WJU2_GRUJA